MTSVSVMFHVHALVNGSFWPFQLIQAFIEATAAGRGGGGVMAICGLMRFTIYYKWIVSYRIKTSAVCGKDMECI